MYIRKQATGYAVEVKKNGKRFYKGGFKTKKSVQEHGAKLEKKK